jgi:hypothetical protein
MPCSGRDRGATTTRGVGVLVFDLDPDTVTVPGDDQLHGPRAVQNGVRHQLARQERCDIYLRRVHPRQASNT